MKKLVVIFPGIEYGVEAPVLHYLDFLFETKQYKRVHIDYGEYFQDATIPLLLRMRELREYELEQLNCITQEDYDEIVFVSKSIGTVEAGFIAHRLGVEVKQIYITPVPRTLKYCDENSIVITGTEDDNYTFYDEQIKHIEMKALIIKDGNHSLEVNQNPLESIEQLKRVVQFVEKNI